MPPRHCNVGDDDDDEEAEDDGGFRGRLLTHYLSLHNAFLLSIHVFFFLVVQTVFCSGIKRRDYWKTPTKRGLGTLLGREKGVGIAQQRRLSERSGTYRREEKKAFIVAHHKTNGRSSVVRRRCSTRRGRETVRLGRE